MNFFNKINAECHPCKNTQAWNGPHCKTQKISIIQRDLPGDAQASDDVSTRNDSETERADTGKIRGIRSLTVRAQCNIEASVLAVPGFSRARFFACVDQEIPMANETPKTLAQLIAEHRARNNIRRSSDRRRTPLIRRMPVRSIARRIKR